MSRVPYSIAMKLIEAEDRNIQRFATVFFVSGIDSEQMNVFQFRMRYMRPYERPAEEVLIPAFLRDAELIDAAKSVAHSIETCGDSLLGEYPTVSIIAPDIQGVVERDHIHLRYDNHDGIVARSGVIGRDGDMMTVLLVSAAEDDQAAVERAYDQAADQIVNILLEHIDDDLNPDLNSIASLVSNTVHAPTVAFQANEQIFCTLRNTNPEITET